MSFEKLCFYIKLSILPQFSFFWHKFFPQYPEVLISISEISLVMSPFFKINLFILLIFFFNLFLAALSPRCCAQAFSSCGEQGPLFVAVRRLLIGVASLVAEHGL